jgi:flavodoxin
MKDILVVCFSRTGYTRRIAEQLAAALGADFEAIREHSSRRGLLGYWRSAHQALRGTAIDIEPGTLQPREYSLVVLGTPVWAGNVSSPMRAYIARHRNDFLRVAFFCTQGGSGAPKVLGRMAALCDQSPVSTAFFNDPQIDAGQHAGKLDAFVAALKARAAA